MKKLVIGLVMLLTSVTAYAAPTVGIFPISVTIPPATTVTYVVSKITGPAAAPLFTPNPTGNSLDFDVTFNTANSIYLGNQFFAIDVAPNGAPNFSSITFSYNTTGQTVPAGQLASEGLNKRGTFTPVRVPATGPEVPLRGFGLPLGSASSVTLGNTDVAGGFLRVYVALATGELTGPAPAPAKIPGSVPFSGADKPGNYSGTLTITATLV